MVRDDAPVTEARPNTKIFDRDARERLGLAVQRAREGAGWPYRPGFVKGLRGVSVSSLLKLEKGEPVGPTVYEAVARKLPGWTEETPRIILEGGDIPPPQAGVTAAAGHAGLGGARNSATGQVDVTTLAAQYLSTGKIDRVDAIRVLVAMIPGIRRNAGDDAANELWQKAMQLALQWRVLDQVATELQDVSAQRP